MDKCTLCGNTTATDDSHHVIPRESGGDAGPRVVICPTCHHTLHRCIKNPVMKDEFLAIVLPESRYIARTLIASIERAKTTGVKSSHVKLNIEIPRELHDRLKLAAEDRRSSIKNLVISILNHVL